MANNMRVGVTAIIYNDDPWSPYNHDYIVMGRRDKDPNRGMFVLPGGAVQDGETLEQALRREVLEETQLVLDGVDDAWQVIHLPEDNRLILVARAFTRQDWMAAESDLAEPEWFHVDKLPAKTSPILIPLLDKMGFWFEGKEYPHFTSCIDDDYNLT